MQRHSCWSLINRRAAWRFVGCARLGMGFPSRGHTGSVVPCWPVGLWGAGRRAATRLACPVVHILLLLRAMSGLHDPLTARIIACAIELHRLTGPGLLESVYDACLAYELEGAGLDFQRQASVSFDYKGLFAQSAFRVDFIVAGAVLVELKCVESILPVHKAQVLTYLKLSGLSTGLLLNFNVPVLREGIRRLVWTRPRLEPPQPSAPPADPA